MTMTVKLEAPLERALRRRSADVGLSASALIREALQTYLTRTEPPAPSAFALGEDLFGQQTGPTNLAAKRKQGLMQIWDQKRPTQRPVPAHGKTGR